jgi:hypothetical protein
MPTPDIELLISHLSGPLNPADRSAFRHAAETALAAWAPKRRVTAIARQALCAAVFGGLRACHLLMLE